MLYEVMGKGMVPGVPIHPADFYSSSFKRQKTRKLPKTRKHRVVVTSFLPALHKSQRWRLYHKLHVEETEAQDLMCSLLREVEEPAQQMKSRPGYRTDRCLLLELTPTYIRSRLCYSGQVRLVKERFYCKTWRCTKCSHLLVKQAHR